MKKLSKYLLGIIVFMLFIIGYHYTDPAILKKARHFLNTISSMAIAIFTFGIFWFYCTKEGFERVDKKEGIKVLKKRLQDKKESDFAGGVLKIIELWRQENNKNNIEFAKYAQQIQATMKSPLKEWLNGEISFNKLYDQQREIIKQEVEDEILIIKAGLPRP